MKQQRVNFQNIQTAHAIQYQKKPKPNQNIGKRPKQIFFQRWQKIGQQTHEKMHNITNSLEKCKSKLQWGITSYWSEWPSSRNMETINAGEVVEQREPSCTVGGNVNWYSLYGEQYGGSLKN